MAQEVAHAKEWREERRLRAWALKAQGWSQQKIAEALGVTAGAVSQWIRRGREGGVAALKRRVAPGPPSKMTAEQRARVPVLLARGAEAYGFRGDVWTAKRVATVIRREIGVRYHPNHVGKLLRAAGWSAQKPITRASQRDEAEIEAWRTERWPALKRHLSVSRGGTESAELPHAV
jgi:transposase